MFLGVMESSNVTEGLFLKNYLGTVSAVPRSRTAAHVETRPSYKSPPVEYLNSNYHLLENGLANHARLIYDTEANIEIVDSEQNRKGRRELQNGKSNEDDDEKDKKKEKKWTLGGLFRRKTKKDADDSSDDSPGEDEGKRGFLSRRKSKRERRKGKTRSTANGFDVVIPKPTSNGVGLTAEQLWSADGRVPESANGPGGPVRFIHRHPVPMTESSKTKNFLQVPKHSRRDSNISRSSGGSDNLEGRKGRKEVMARAEAKRDMMHDESSSDECDSYHSNSSLNRLNADQRDGLRRLRRQKRLSKDEEYLSQNDFRIIKSDFEGGRRFPGRWNQRIPPDSSDREALRLVNHSGTPSPSRSPRVRQKQLLQYMSLVPNSYPTSTFPPGGHFQQSRTAAPSQNRSQYAKDVHLHGSQPFVTYRSPGQRASEYIQNLPRSLSSMENASNRRTLDHEQLSGPKEKSLSFDQDIHRASRYDNEPNVQKEYFRRHKQEVANEEKRKKDDVYNANVRAGKESVIENRTESALSIQPGTFPSQPTQTVQRTRSENTFGNAFSFFPNRSNSYQHISVAHNAVHKRNPCYWSQDEGNSVQTKDNLYTSIPHDRTKTRANAAPSILRYYADQNPRSRNPIHITCNPMSNTSVPEQPYLSDSQVVLKGVQPRPSNASDFWKLKEQEMMKNRTKQADNSSLKPPITQSDRSRSSSPRSRHPFKASENKACLGVNGCLKQSITPGKQTDNSKVLKEEEEDYNAKVNQTPPEPPVRRLTKQEVRARCEQLKNKEDIKFNNSNLDEALNELELIYNSLRLKDEDLVDRAERRDLPVYRPKMKEYNHISVRDIIPNFYAETNASSAASRSGEANGGHQRAMPLRKSGVPDKMADDMAYRRMNSRERSDAKKFHAQSYLRSSPGLSPVSGGSPTFQSSAEPDVTYDDVVFRNIRHANSTLKIQDPQPPFGIPIGVITPAPNSDYLHATPKERFRPTFTSSKTPDVVKDDLAFRNLRKDNKTNNCLAEAEKTDANGLLKKRAVRSLSANLYNIMQKNNSGFVTLETNNNVIFDKSCEKTQSLTDLSSGSWADKQVLEKRLKELKEEKNAKRAEFFESSQESRKKGGLSWTELANLNGNFEAGKHDVQKKVQVGFPPDDPNRTHERKSFRSPIVELSKYPAAAPTSTLQGNPFKELSAPVDDDQLEDLLSALAMEAKNASKDLERQLDELETKSETEGTKTVKSKESAIEEFNAKFKANSVEKNKRRRNLSLSNGYEAKEEGRQTGSLERRMGRKPAIRRQDSLEFPREKTNEYERTSHSGFRPEEKKPERVETFKSDKKDTKLSRSDSSNSQTFQLVTDLSQILHDAEGEHHLKEMSTMETTDRKDVFQEVYEYNCKLAERRESRDEIPVEEKKAEGSVELTRDEEEEEEATASDLEKEFEKLHEEVDASTAEVTKDRLVDDLMADIGSVVQSGSESYSSFPFPNEVDGRVAYKTSSERPARHRHRNGTSGKRSGKGEGERKNATFDSNLWLACSYALAFAFQLQEVDFLTALGIVLAVITIVAILIL